MDLNQRCVNLKTGMRSKLDGTGTILCSCAVYLRIMLFIGHGFCNRLWLLKEPFVVVRSINERWFNHQSRTECVLGV